MPEPDRGRSIAKHRHYSPEREVEAEDESPSFGDRGGYHGHRDRERAGSRSGSKSSRRRRHHHHHHDESPSRSSKPRRHKTPVDTWLGENGMKEYREAFYDQGFDELIDVFFCAMCDPIFRTIVPKRGHQLKLQRQLSLYFSPQQLQMMNAQGGAAFPSASHEMDAEQPPGFPQGPQQQQPSPFYQPFSPPMPPGPLAGWGGGDSPSPMVNRGPGGGESPPPLPPRGGRGGPPPAGPPGHSRGYSTPVPPLYPPQGRPPPQQPSFGSYEGESPSYPGGPPHLSHQEPRGRTPPPLHGRPPTPVQGPGGRGRRNSGFSSVGGGSRRRSPSPVDEYAPSHSSHQVDYMDTMVHGRRHSYHSHTPPPGQTSRRGSTTVHHHPFQPEPQQAPTRSATPTQRLSWFPGASGPSPDLQTVFLYFCKFGDKENPGRMNSFKWAKLLRELRLIDGNLNIQEADIIFHKVKPMKGKTVDYDEFCEAIPFLAATKYPRMDPDRAIDHFLRALNENL